MKTTCACFFLLLLLTPIIGFAASSLQINSATDITFNELPETITLQFEQTSPGERIDIEFYIDVNYNNIIDLSDFMFDFVTLVDGIGWIRDNEAPENDIPGDENEAAGVISTTLPVTRENHLCGRQNWLLRTTGDISAMATVRWVLDKYRFSVWGSVKDNYTNLAASGQLLFAREIDFPEKLHTTLSDSSGHYYFPLEPGTWQICAQSCSDTLVVNVCSEKKIRQDLLLNPLASFFTGRVQYKNGTPAPGFVITAQNRELMQFYSAISDQDGSYILNVVPGTFQISCSPALNHLLGNRAWPEGFFAVPQCDTLLAVKAKNSIVNIRLEQYPTILHGRCQMNGKGLAGVLVQGAAKNSLNGEIELFQTWTREDGSYHLGTNGDPLLTLIAQKTGGILHPASVYNNLTAVDVTASYDFVFCKENPLMTISGTLYHDDLTPAVDVPVIAFNPEEKSVNGYIIQKTNTQGQFCFHPEVEGAWQIGLYKKDFKSVPPLHYLYVNEGMACTDIKFYLYLEKAFARFDEGHFKPAALNIIPNQPLPFEPVTSIQFVLPEERCTRIQMLDLAGNYLCTLVDEKLSGGKHTIAWDGADNNGAPLSCGIYLCRIDAVNESMQQPITLLR